VRPWRWERKGWVALLPLGLSAVAGCTLPNRPPTLPAPDQGYVAVLSGEMPGPLSQVARHAWIIAHVPRERDNRRYELGVSGSDPFGYFGDGDVALHGVVRYDPEHLDAVVACLERERNRYFRDHPDYFLVPGPNSNTIIDTLLRHCKIHVELPATAVGRDYRGVIGASVTSLGTGVQLETWLIGAKIGLEEGVELHIADVAFGVHFWPPALTVPVNPGRIGFDGTMHAPAFSRRRWSGESDVPDDAERKYGVASFWMGARYARVDHPDEARGLSDEGTVGLSVRASYGRHVGYGFGAEFEGGLGFPLGYAYAARLYPTGVAYAFHGNSFVGLFGGVGIDGVTSTVPAALELPLELRMEVDVARQARVGARAAVAWYPAAPERRGGSLLSPFADELTMGTFARFGRSPPCGCSELRAGRGYFFGLERREIFKTAWLGLTFGVEMDLGGAGRPSAQAVYDAAR
jgi:hypothetical protein